MITLLLGLVMHLLAGHASAALVSPLSNRTVLASHEFSLENRYDVPSVNKVFKDNILLTLAYARNLIPVSQNPDWKKVEEPFRWILTVKPNQTISFDDKVMQKFAGSTVFVPVHFTSYDGYLSDGWLVGDGVCHLASLFSWVAKDAGLDVTALVNHDFAPIPEVPKEQGVSIFAFSDRQNLYITNNKEKPVDFVFAYDGTELKISAEE